MAEILERLIMLLLLAKRAKTCRQGFDRQLLKLNYSFLLCFQDSAGSMALERVGDHHWAVVSLGSCDVLEIGDLRRNCGHMTERAN